MTSQRAQAYGRVMDALRDIGPSKLTAAEQEQIREVADALLFCESATDARAALERMNELTRHLVDSGRWLPESAERLVEDVTGCGPAVLV